MNRLNLKLKLEIRINGIVNKLKYLLYVFYKLKCTLRKQRFIQIFYGLHDVYIAYGYIACGGVYNATLELLIRNITKKNIEND